MDYWEYVFIAAFLYALYDIKNNYKVVKEKLFHAERLTFSLFVAQVGMIVGGVMYVLDKVFG